MHRIAPYETSVSLFGDNGSVRCFASLREALKALGYDWIVRNVERHFVRWEHNSTWFDASVDGFRSSPSYRTSRYIMRNDAGDPVTASDFDHLRRKNRFPWGRWNLLATWNGEGPVPGVHHQSAGQHYYRKVRHLNARKGCATFKDEGEVPPRAARNVHHLPNNWDDFKVSQRNDRNWKHFRKTRWKTVKEAV